MHNRQVWVDTGVVILSLKDALLCAEVDTGCDVALSRTEAQRKIITQMNESSLRCQLVNVTCSSCRDCRFHTGFTRKYMIARDDLGSASFNTYRFGAL